MQLPTTWRLTRFTLRVLPFTILTTLGLVAVVSYEPLRRWHTLLLVLLSASAAVMLGVFAVGRWAHLRVKAEVVRMRWQCCPRCLYDLSKLRRDGPDEVRCPECGHSTTWDVMRDYWRESFHPFPKLRRRTQARGNEPSPPR